MPDFEGFPGGAVVKNPPANAGDTRDMGFDPWVSYEMATYSNILH